MSYAKGRMGFIGLARVDTDLKFQYNPQSITYSRDATYSKNTAAFADFPNSAPSAIPSMSWIRNEAETINMDIMFDWIDVADLRTSGRPNKFNVESALQQLDDFMRPDANTGKPRDLFLALGSGRSDRIRILQKTVTGKMFDTELRCTQATVSLRFTAMTSRIRS